MFVFGGENNDYQYMSSSMIYDAYKNAWVRLPNAPHTMRCGPQAVWAETTSEFIVYGCVWSSSLSKYLVSGMAIDPETTTWREIAPAPLTAREGFAIAWVNDRLVVWGGADEKSKGPNGTARSDGAAYDPATDTWEPLAPAPIAARYGASFASDGSKLFVVGGYAQAASSAFADGAMYDGATGAWTALPQLPATSEGAAAWTDGTKLWLWSGRQNGTMANVGYVYDVATTTWSTLARAPISASAHANAAWTGSTGVVFGGRLESGALTDSGAILVP
jgi:N-acetylneuraminic acid mutarotase